MPTEAPCATALLPACPKNTHRQSTEHKSVLASDHAELPFIESRPSWSRTSAPTRSGKAFDTWRYLTVYAPAGQPQLLRRTAGYSELSPSIIGSLARPT